MTKATQASDAVHSKIQAALNPLARLARFAESSALSSETKAHLMACAGVPDRLARLGAVPDTHLREEALSAYRSCLVGAREAVAVLQRPTEAQALQAAFAQHLSELAKEFLEARRE